MKYYAKLIPFVSEMIAFFFVVCVTIMAMFAGFVYGSLLVQIVTITMIIVQIICFIRLFSRVIMVGIKALWDFMLHRTEADCYVFVQEIPYQASAFGEKWEKGRIRCRGTYYLVKLKKGDKVYNYTASFSLKLKKGDVCRVVIASTSRIILMCQKRELEVI